jgi:glycosyltransferase involved in cell wall biosynthesis
MLARTRIAVNTRLLLPNRLEGIGWFTYETLKRIVRNHPECDFLFLFDRPFDSKYIFADNVKGVHLGPPARHPVLYRIWFNYTIPFLLAKHNAELFLSPDGYLSLRTDVKQIAVMHDLNFEHYPEDLPKVHRDYYRQYFPLFARKAERIITVSEYSKQDIHEQYGVSTDHIDVAYNGVSEIFTPDEQDDHPFCDGKPYFLSVGSLHPRKNIARLLEAFDLACKRCDSDIQLLIVGESFYWSKDMKLAMDRMAHKDRVHFTGRMEQAGLKNAYSHALALAYVSYFEGFGIPLVEAMRCGCPVIAADATALPEIASDAAIYCDPFNTSDIAEKMICLATDEGKRIELREAGLKRSQQFSWDRTAAAVWNTIERTLNA